MVRDLNVFFLKQICAKYIVGGFLAHSASLPCSDLRFGWQLWQASSRPCASYIATGTGLPGAQPQLLVTDSPRLLSHYCTLWSLYPYAGSVPRVGEL